MSLFPCNVLLQVESPEQALKAICDAEDWGAIQAMVVGLKVNLQCLLSVSLKSVCDIPQHYVDKKYMHCIIINSSLV